MAASANPSAAAQNNGNGGANNTQGGSGGGGGAANGNGGANNGVSVPDNTVLQQSQALRHNPGLSADWTTDEQSLLEDLLKKYASETVIVRYAKIAMQLQDKTVRDVALRCRWMTKKENGKRRKDNHNSSRKSKDKKEKVTDSAPKSQATNRTNGPPYAQPTVSMDSDDGISCEAIGGVSGQLLEQNSQALNQISANFSAFKIHENLNLFCVARNNIYTILNDLNDMPEVMKQMPPLPVKLNEELASSVLPSRAAPPAALSKKS